MFKIRVKKHYSHMYMPQIKNIRCDCYYLNNVFLGEEFEDGTKFWYKEGKFHNEDGPACEYYDIKEFWLEGEHLSESDWKVRMKLKCLR